jgi:superoxide dismutase, Cu-Zn family
MSFRSFIPWSRTRVSSRTESIRPEQAVPVRRFALATPLMLILALPTAAQSADEHATAVLRNASGNDVGKVSITQTRGGALLKLSINGIPPGEHAFHIHAMGKCDGPSFDSAGPHFNPDNAHHGIMSGGGHAGDMPNLHVPQNGALELEVINAAITLDHNKPNSVFRPEGTSVVIHGGKDDYTSDPAGNAGNRIACGVIRQAPATVGQSPAK